MTEGLWQDPEQAKEQDFQNLIEQAHKNGAQLEREHVQVLSDLSAEQVRRWKDVWIRLPVGTRRRIVALCDRLLEDDPRLSFFEVGRIALEDEDAEVREYGLRLIGIEDLEARVVVPLLIRHLWDEAPTVRARAAEELGRFVLQGMVDQMPFALLRKAVAALLYILHEEPPTAPVWAQALMAVSYAAPRGLGEFLEFAYYQGDIELRCAALVAMGRTLTPAWKRYILADLQHPHPKVRAAAAEAAGFAEIREALDDVLYLLTDASKEVRMAAAWAVSELAEEDEHFEILEQAWRQAQEEDEIEALEAALQNLEFRLMRREWSLLELALKDEWERGQPPTLDLREAQNGASNGNGSKASSPTSDPEEPGSAGAA